MRDRQIFETETLKNDITIYYYKSENPFVVLSVMIPIGSAHSGDNNNIIMGTPHFFEHLILHRSKRHSKKDEFMKWVGSKGGFIIASTNQFTTIYTIQIKAEYVQDAWQGLYSLIFEPLLDTEDIEIERSIIINERGLCKWFPGDSELSNYIWSHWMDTTSVTRRQIFGDDTDLSKMSNLSLTNFHSLYKSQGIHVIVAGPSRIPDMYKELDNIPTRQVRLIENSIPFSWKKKGYHESAFSDIEAPIYFTGTFYDLPSEKERAAIHFLFEYLTNFSNGPIYKWLRQEKGWVYEVNYHRIITKKQEAIVLEIPLQNLLQVNEVKNELSKHIETAISNPDLLRAEVDRQLDGMVFSYQTVENIVSEALHDVEHYGFVTSEAKYQQYKELCVDPAYIQMIYIKYFAPELRGEFCAIPKQF